VVVEAGRILLVRVLELELQPFERDGAVERRLRGGGCDRCARRDLRMRPSCALPRGGPCIIRHMSRVR
jgi:hypothetical protein